MILKIGTVASSGGRKPGTPVIGTATGGNGQATVTFFAPDYTGKPNTSLTYTVTSNPGSISATGSSSPITVTGLNNGTSYTFSVKLNNTVMDSDSSDNSNPVSPVAPPSFSDARDKTNVESLTLGLDFVNKLNPTTYTWNMRDGSLVDVDDFGFLAQDLVALEDSVDGHERLRLTHRENPDKLMISQDRLIPILVKAIQDLSKQIEDLKKQ